MTYDAGRIRHSMDLMHYAKGSNGSSIGSNWGPRSTGDTGIVWMPPDTGGGSVSFGSNSSAVAELSLVGGGTDAARSTHYHAGVNSITSSSSNTLQRGVVNLRAGTNVGFGLSDTDGDGEFDTLTITSSGAGGGGGGASISDYVSGRSGTGQLVIPRMKWDPDIPPASPNSDDQEFTSSLSGWTTRGTLDTQNANSTLSDNLYIARNAGATGVNGIDRSFSSSRPKTIIAKLTAVSGGVNFHNAFLYFTDGTKYHTYGPINETSDALIERADWSNRTTRSGQNDSDTVGLRAAYMGPLWLRVILTTDSNIAVAYSLNGITYVTTSSGVNPGFTLSNYGFGVNDFASGKNVELYVDYARFT